MNGEAPSLWNSSDNFSPTGGHSACTLAERFHTYLSVARTNRSVSELVRDSGRIAQASVLEGVRTRGETTPETDRAPGRGSKPQTARSAHPFGGKTRGRGVISVSPGFSRAASGAYGAGVRLYKDGGPRYHDLQAAAGLVFVRPEIRRFTRPEDPRFCPRTARASRMELYEELTEEHGRTCTPTRN